MKPHLALILALLAAGCEHAEGKRAAAQVLAKVNGTEISAAQASNPQALEKIIDRELLVQKALQAGLERDPQVAQALDNARRQLLAQAYLERAAAREARSTPEEVHAFYIDNPALFAERRVYRLRELVVAAPPELIDVLRAEAAGARELDEVAFWLKSRNAKFSASTTTQPAEQLPLSYLPQLARMKQGEIAVFGTPLGASVIQLVHCDEAPLSEQQAQPVIEQFLGGRKRLELASAEVKRLRGAARIEYLGDSKR